MVLDNIPKPELLSYKKSTSDSIDRQTKGNIQPDDQPGPSVSLVSCIETLTIADLHVESTGKISVAADHQSETSITNPEINIKKGKQPAKKGRNVKKKQEENCQVIYKQKRKKKKIKTSI